MRHALESLSDVDRELVTLTTWEGLSPADAARVVGITAGTARVRLHRARARLARHPRLQALFAAADEAPADDAPADDAPADEAAAAEAPADEGAHGRATARETAPAR